MSQQQIVVFSLKINGHKAEYGIPIIQVQEINRITEVTRLPQTPVFVEGIINLRGCIVPLIDIKKRFGLGHSEQSEDRRIIVFVLDGQKTGIIVDDVNEVMHVDVEEMQFAELLSVSDSARYLTGIARVEDRIVLILDLEKVLSLDESKELIGV